MKAIYEVRLAGRDVQINATTWDTVRNYVRNNKWFYIMYMGKRYKYVKDQTYYDRPTRFDFEVVEIGEEEPIYYIYL